MEHGGDLTLAQKRFGGTRADWLDLSTGINPHPYPVPRHLPPSMWSDLPSGAGLERLLLAARAAYRVPGHVDIAAAPGTQLLISLLPRLLPDGKAAVAAPTYSSHQSVWTREERTLTEVSSVHALPAEARIVILVNPNNPDGQLTDTGSLLHIARTLTERGGCLVVDEAFADTVPGSSLLPHLGSENVIVLRSFGKFYGLAGIRIGFAAGQPELIDKIRATLECWSLSGPALEIGASALEDESWRENMLRRLADEMADLTIALSQAGLSVFGGTPLFALAGHRHAAALHEGLARRRIWTRVFDYAPTWIRFGLPGSADAMERLSEALIEAQREL